MLLARSQLPESPEACTPSPQPRAAVPDRLLRLSGAPEDRSSPDPLAAQQAPAPAGAASAPQAAGLSTPSPAQSAAAPPHVADASRPFSRLQRLMQVAETESPASDAEGTPAGPHDAPSPAFMLSPPTPAEAPAQAAADAAEQPQAEQAATPEAQPAGSPAVAPTPAPPSAVAPLGQPVMGGAFVEIVRSVSTRAKRTSDTAAGCAAGTSGVFEIRSALGGPQQDASALATPASALSSDPPDGDRLTTACHAAVEWGRRAGIAAAQIDKLRAEVQRFRLEAAHWLQQHRELSAQHKAELARHKQEFAIYQREMEAAIAALEQQYRLDTELAKSQHEAAFRAGIAAARAEGMALASAEGVTVSMAADAALAAAARAAAAIERQRADEAERRAAVAEAALAQVLAEREQERAALANLVASASKQAAAAGSASKQAPARSPAAASVAPAASQPAASFRSRALALLAESTKEDVSPAPSSASGPSPAMSSASRSGGARQQRPGAPEAAAAAAQARRFAGCMSPPKTAETEADAAAASAEAAAPSSSDAAAQPVQETPVRNLAAPFRMAVVPEGGQAPQEPLSRDGGACASSAAPETPALTPIAAPSSEEAFQLPATPGTVSPGRKGWVARLGFITLRFGVSHPVRSP